MHIMVAVRFNRSMADHEEGAAGMLYPLVGSRAVSACD